MTKQTRNLFKRLAAIAVIVTSSIAGVATVAGARQGAVSMSLFSGVQGSLNLAGWGSGNAREVEKPVLIGTRAIQITTQGFYQGGRMTLREPADLSAAFANPKTYIRMQVRFDTTAIGSVAPGGSAPGKGSPPSGIGGPPPGFGGGPPPGFVPPPSGLGGGGSLGGVQSGKFAASPFERMRYVLTMADGTRYEMIRPVVIPPTQDGETFVPISFPVQALLKKGDGTKAAVPTGDGAKLKEIALFGDVYQQFLVGEIEVVTDDTEISVSPIEEPIVYVNDSITFGGGAEGGTTTLRYSWDFDSTDGIQEDAVGRVVAHVFRTGGKRTVTLTVSDEDGIKKSDQKSVTFEVTGDQ